MFSGSSAPADACWNLTVWKTGVAFPAKLFEVAKRVETAGLV